jgi:hypothetical protein
MFGYSLGNFCGFPPFVTLASICRDLRYDELDARILHHSPRIIRNAFIGDQRADPIKRAEDKA